MPAKNSGLYFNGSMLFLFLALLGMFLIWTPWTDCAPLSTFDPASYPKASIPAGAECFYINHGDINFLSWASQWRHTWIFLAIDAMFILGCILLIQASRRR